MIRYWVLLFMWAIGVMSLFTFMVVLQPPLTALAYIILSFVYGFIGCILLWVKN